jgi:prevent-host-death family protein
MRTFEVIAFVPTVVDRYHVHKRQSSILGENQTMRVVDIRNRLADAINRVAYAGERIILERRGKGVAALVSMEDVALLEELENEADIRAAKKALKEKGRIPLEQIKARLGMK